jgi:hypothetical protein
MKTLSVILSVLITLGVYSQNVIYWKSVDTNIVKSYLYQSFNEFRVKHGKTTVLTSDSLNKVCGRYSKKLVSNYGHASETERGGLIECIAKSSFYYYNYKLHRDKPIMVDPKQVNVNKMVADILFEIFEVSESHMDLLMSDYKVYGFGFTISEDYFYVVVRGK